MSATDEHPEIRSQQLENGETLIELKVAERAVSRLYIIPRTISIGVARVRVDGIGGVETEEEYRGRGYARRVMEAALARMGGENTVSQDPAALSFLFGIPNFYEKFGYAQAGPWYSLHLTELSGGDSLPDGWTVRSCTPHDLPAIHALYERGTAQAVGAVIRHPSGHVWSTLAAVVADSSRDECRVVVDPSRAVAAYAWRGRDFWPVDTEEETPDALVIGEAIALGPTAADVLLAAMPVLGTRGIGSPAQHHQSADFTLSRQPDLRGRHSAPCETRDDVGAEWGIHGPDAARRPAACGAGAGIDRADCGLRRTPAAACCDSSRTSGRPLWRLHRTASRCGSAKSQGKAWTLPPWFISPRRTWHVWRLAPFPLATSSTGSPIHPTPSPDGGSKCCFHRGIRTHICQTGSDRQRS